MSEKYTINLTVEGEKKDIEKFIEHNLVSCSYAQIKNVEIKKISNLSKRVIYSERFHHLSTKN